MIYFDNAATTFPKPTCVSRAITECLCNCGGNPGRSGHKMSLKAAEIVYNLRDHAALLFGAKSPENVIITKNCTESLNIAINSIMCNGGNAIISCLEHNSVVRPLENLRLKGIADYRIVNFLSMSDVDELNNICDNNTKMIICTHASNVTGAINPIKKLSRFCKQKNIIFCVDASQTAGIIDINMQKDDIDILCLPGHKALFGPTGMGLLILNKDIPLSPLIYGGTGTNSLDYNMPAFLPERLESGTINVVGCAGLNAGISFINKIGINNIYEHELELSQLLYDKLANIRHIILYEDYPTKNNAISTISFTVKQKTCTDVSEALNAKNIAVRSGYHCSPLAHRFLGTLSDGTIRVSLSLFNTKKEINSFICAINKINS